MKSFLKVTSSIFLKVLGTVYLSIKYPWILGLLMICLLFYFKKLNKEDFEEKIKKN